MDRFGCPVIDLYSMNESGPLAARDPGGAWRWLRPDILLELLGPDDLPVADGARGEITLTGGNNPYLPLLRYRTGDFASVSRSPEAMTLIDLEGRPPVLFHTPDGRIINTIDVSIAMKQHALSQFTLHQRRDGHGKPLASNHVGSPRCRAIGHACHNGAAAGCAYSRL